MGVIVQEYEQDDAIYLFRFENRWLIGNNFHEDSCRAFLELESDSIEDLGVADWNFVNEAEPGFFLEYSRIIQVYNNIFFIYLFIFSVYLLIMTIYQSIYLTIYLFINYYN